MKEVTLMFNKLMLLLILFQTECAFSQSKVVKGVPSFRSIGPGPSCHFDTTNGATLQDILNSGTSEIRLVNSVTYSGTFNPVSGTYIRGGYNDCTDAINDIQSPTQSLLDGDFLGSTLTLSINGSYILENIKIINGLADDSAPDNSGGGLNLTALDMTVKLDRTIVENNSATLGAGIYKPGGIGVTNNVHLTLVDSIIQGNTTLSSGMGGGVYFAGLGEVIVYGNTHITDNEAEHGGGLYLTDTIATFIVGANSPVNSGITNNKATINGGGIYAQNSNIEISGGTKNMAGIGMIGASGKNYIILGNIADSDINSSGNGGGLYLDAFSDVTLSAISIISNQAFGAGGGIMLKQTTNLDIGFPENSDCQITTLNGCNFFINNSASQSGGALYLDTNSLADLRSVNFNRNRADDGTVAVAFGSSRINISSSIMYNNGDSGSNGFNDTYALGLFASSQLYIEQSTAVKNKTTTSFIRQFIGNNLLVSYNNYFYNPLSGPWIDLFSNSGSVTHDCQMVDATNNSNDTMHHLFTTNANANDNLYFVDEANNDFHLSDSSDLIDFVGTECPTNPNLFNNGRDIDNQHRTTSTDLGADENLINDIIFKNAFEG